jgi:hypothetical protein
MNIMPLDVTSHLQLLISYRLILILCGDGVAIEASLLGHHRKILK